jgi:eukaryotic-like serine/threonine-protein kinase
VNLERWRQADEIFQSLVKKDPDQRSRLLDQACSNDPLLKEEVEKLLRAHQQSSGFLESAGFSLAGKTLGSYQVQSLFGVGGMGEVYRARDTKLKRDVALKVLPDSLDQDADRISRFRREAEMLASLNHPNIGAIYDVQEFDGSHFLEKAVRHGDERINYFQRNPRLAPIRNDPRFQNIIRSVEARRAARH